LNRAFPEKREKSRELSGFAPVQIATAFPVELEQRIYLSEQGITANSPVDNNSKNR
jgi:hypothetical protein